MIFECTNPGGKEKGFSVTIATDFWLSAWTGAGARWLMLQRLVVIEYVQI